MPDSLADLLPARSGHFLFESGYHGDRWLELDTLWTQPARLEPLVSALTQRLAAHRPDALCGPQTGGAHLARLIAAQLGLPYFGTAKIPPVANADQNPGQLYQVRYLLPPTDQAAVRDRRIALVDDVINAGSASRATLEELAACGARPVALGALLVLNDQAALIATRYGLPLEFLERQKSHLWKPADCPLCARGVPVTIPG